jgi:hypothetical protein
MAYFAKLDENNKVLKVESVHDNECKDENGVEQESKGQEFLRTLYKEPTAVWKQTSYNYNFRKQYAAIGDTFDSSKNKFISPQPYPSWSLNSNDDWEAPIAYPDDDKEYEWNETTRAWDEI